MIDTPNDVLFRFHFLENEIHLAAYPFSPFEYEHRHHFAFLCRVSTGIHHFYGICMTSQPCFRVYIHLAHDMFQFEMENVRIDEVGDFDGKFVNRLVGHVVQLLELYLFQLWNEAVRQHVLIAKRVMSMQMPNNGNFQTNTMRFQSTRLNRVVISFALSFQSHSTGAVYRLTESKQRRHIDSASSSVRERDIIKMCKGKSGQSKEDSK